MVSDEHVHRQVTNDINIPIKQAPRIDLFFKNRYGTSGNLGNLVSYQQKIGNKTSPPSNIALIVLLCQPPGTFAARVSGRRISANDVATRTRPTMSSSWNESHAVARRVFVDSCIPPRAALSCFFALFCAHMRDPMTGMRHIGTITANWQILAIRHVSWPVCNSTYHSITPSPIG